MTYLKYIVLLLTMAVGLSSSSTAHAQGVIDWLPTGTGNWNDDPNWADIGFGNFKPEAQYDDTAQIANGGTAQVTNTPPDVSGIQVNSGTLEVTSSGNLTSRPGDNGIATGNVNVAAGGTLHVASGGSLTVDANLSLAGVYRVGLTPAQNPISVTGRATLAGGLVADFSGATVSHGSTWDLIDATAFSGNFASVSTTGVTLPLGQVFNLQQTTSGSNGNLLQVEVEQRLVMNLDRDTGIASIENVGSSPVSLAMDSYLVQSAVGSLSPSSWNSLQDQGFEDASNPWAEGGTAAASMNALAEFNPRTSATLAPGASRQLGAIYAPNYLGLPLGAETEDHTFSYTNNGQTYQGVINYVGEKQENNLVLTVNPSTGEATMQNESGRGFAIDSYTIASADGSLLTSWDSLQDQGGAGGVWLEANPSANRLSEVTEEGSTFLSQNQGFNLSTLFNTGSAQDLTFQYFLAGTTTVVDGMVVYGDLPTNIAPPSSFDNADFNEDSTVDGDDLTAWNNGYGTTVGAVKGDGDFDNDSDVDGFDFLGWQRNFGNTTAVAAVGSAVPEPTSLTLLLVGALGFVGWQRRRS